MSINIKNHILRNNKRFLSTTPKNLTLSKFIQNQDFSNESKLIYKHDIEEYNNLSPVENKIISNSIDYGNNETKNKIKNNN